MNQVPTISTMNQVPTSSTYLSTYRGENRKITSDIKKFKQDPFSANEVLYKFIEGEALLQTVINQIFGQVMNKLWRKLRPEFALRTIEI